MALPNIFLSFQDEDDLVTSFVLSPDNQVCFTLHREIYY